MTYECSYSEKLAIMMEQFFNEKNFDVYRSSDGVFLIKDEIFFDVQITDAKIEIVAPSIKVFDDPYAAFRYSFLYEKHCSFFRVSPFLDEENKNTSFLSLLYTLPVFEPHDMVREVTSVNCLVQEAHCFIKEELKLVDRVVRQ